MTRTSHGHHIPDSPTNDEDTSFRVARCGGPGLCALCSLETGKYAEAQFLQAAVEKALMSGYRGHTPVPEAARYQSKPSEIVAIQWEGGPGPGLDIVAWIKRSGHNATFTAAQPESTSGDLVVPEIFESITVETDSGWATAQPGWWIIQDAGGSFYPCPPDVFDRKYEPKE